MIRLLKILKSKIELLEKDEMIDFRMIKTIISYLRNYSDKYHHPMEDFIFDYYTNSRTVPDDIATRLPQEHKMIKKATNELDELLGMILLDAIVPQQQCIEKLQYFVELQTAHIVYEEHEIFPLIEASLSDNEWQEIEQQWQSKEYSDPLFGDNVSEQYRQLAMIVKQVD